MTANRVLSCLRKMFNMAEVWGFRDDGTNPCRHIPKYPESGKTRLITDDEMVRLFGYLERADVEGLEHPFLTLGIRLQFAFAARMSEIISMEWALGRLRQSSCRVARQQDRRNLEAHERGRLRASFERTAPGRLALRRAFYLQSGPTDVPEHLL